MQKDHLPTNLFGFIFYFIKKQWVGFILLLLTMSAWAVQEAVYPYFIKLIVDNIASYTGEKKNIFSHLSHVLIISAVVAVIIEANFLIHDFLMANVYPRFMARIRMNVYKRVQHHTQSFFAENLAGTISSKITNLPEGAQRLIDEFITIFWPIVLTIIISCLLLSLEHPIFALMIIVWVAIYIAISLSFGRNFQNFSMVRSSKLNVLNGKIADVIGNIGNVRLFSRYKFEEKYLGKYQSEEQEAYRKSLIYNSYMECWLGLANVIFLFAMVGGAIYLYQEGKITLGDVALVLSYHSLLSLVWYIGMELIVFYEILGSCNEALSLLREPYSIVDKEDASNLKVSEGKIEFRQVVFNYSSKNKIFNNESVLIPGRQKVGLVGFSGSGKTTFVNLLLRYFDVKSGAILIDNQDIKDVTQSSLREAIAVIPQEPTLFHRSLIENIRYGKLEATDEEVIRAAQLAHAHEFIENLPESYQTLVGERGTKLSGGQRQRIAIARAILKNAPILVLDEATSALDSITEGKIQESLHSLMADKTVIVIAHRLSTLLNMDRILVFNNGVIVEEGSHEELLAREGIYTSLWNMQGSGFVTDEEEGTGE